MTRALAKATIEDPASRILDIMDRMEPRFRRRFLNSVRFLRDQRTLAEIEALLVAGRLNEALSGVEAAARALAAEWSGVFVIAGEETGGFIGRSLGILTDFDQVNTRAVTAMQQNSLRLIREFTQGQRDAVAEALRDGVRRGLNPREQARAFRDSIGLTGKQEQAVQNYRRLLERGDRAALTRRLRDRRFDPQVLRAAREGRQLGADQIDRMVARYRQRFINFRAETIARTEALRSVHEGAEAMYQQAIDDGTLDPAELIKIWNTAKDERVRGSHRSMHRQERRINEPFTSGRGNSLRHPGDASAPPEDTVRCRCAVGRRFVA